MIEEHRLFDFIVYDSNPYPIINEELRDFANKHRVLDPIEKKLDAESWEIKKSIIERNNSEFLSVIKLFNTMKLNYISLKGPAMLKYYPENQVRQSIDYDILVKDTESFYEAIRLLKSRNIELSQFPVLCRSGNNTIGFAKFAKNYENEPPLYMEINIAGFPIGTVDWVINNSIFESAQTIEVNNVSIKVPDDKYNLLIFLYEACGRDKPRLRDVVDFYFLYRNIDNSVIKEIKEELADKPFVLKVLNEFIKIYNNHNSSQYSLSNRYTRKSYCEYLHTFPKLLSNKKPLASIVYYYANMIGEYFYYKDKLLKLVKLLDSKINAKKKFNLGIPTHFIPLEDLEFSKTEWEQKEGIDFFTTPIGIFIPTNFAIFKKGEYEEVLDICKRHYSKG